MSGQTKLAGTLIVNLALFAGTSGCTVSIQPWTKPSPIPTPIDMGAPVAPPYAFQKGPAPLMPLTPPPPGNNETMSMMIKQYNELDEQRRALSDQVGILRKQLKDREGNLRLASFEVEESTKQLKRTRDEFRQWQMETEELRDRIKKLEDSRASLRPLIEELLQLVRSNDASKHEFLDRAK